jgi:hypothetical protein
MRWFTVALLATTFIYFAARAGGDLPFPFSDPDRVTLVQTWKSRGHSVEVRIYRTREGETQMLLKDLRTGEYEVPARMDSFGDSYCEIGK